MQLLLDAGQIVYHRNQLALLLLFFVHLPNYNILYSGI
jgi:hypothetical protein